MMPSPDQIIRRILPDVTRSRVKLSGVDPTIGTAAGTAHYIGTEIESPSGRWNDSYQTRDGYWVIHEGHKHHVYKV